MSRISGWLRKICLFPLHAFFWGIYPVFHLWAANLGETTPAAVAFSLLVSFIYSLVVLGLALAVARQFDKAGALAGWFLILSVLYGSGCSLSEDGLAPGLPIGYLRLLALAGAAFVAGAVIILRTRRDLRQLTAWANLLSAGLILFTLIRILPFEIQTAAARRHAPAPSASVRPADTSAPDIYYIILDGYARSDALLSEEGYDNSAFIAGLRKRGFYVAECAFSNYPSTYASIASSLNMSYLTDLGFDEENVLLNDKPAELEEAIYNNRARQLLAEHGYKFAALRGFAPVNDIQTADYYFEYYDASAWDTALETRDFEHLYLNTTFFRALVEAYEQHTEAPIWEKLPAWLYALADPDGIKFFSRSYAWYGQHMYAFQALEKFPSLPGRKFFYAHIYATHQPFVLRADGSFPWPINEDYDGYIPAVTYVSGRILRAIDVILKKSSVPPVILLQADHGIGEGVTHNKILSAYYLPRGNQDLTATITPVNSLRVVLRSYFGEPADLLEERVAVVSPPGSQPQIEYLNADCEQ